MLDPQQALRQYFGFDDFREGQKEVVQRLLQGRHSLLVMPTGSGKSLTYQLPALLMPGLTLVISPLIALMKDQVDGLVESGLPASYINSSLPQSEVKRRLRALQEEQIKLLYIAPERLRSRNFTRVLAKVDVSLLAVDEAHCISQWGHDFRPDYLQIGPMWQAMGEPTLLATTATATETVRQDIVKILGLKNIQPIVTGFNRPNLTFRVTMTPDAKSKLEALQSLLKNVEGSAIVYAATRRNTEEVASFITHTMKIPALPYHGGMNRDMRHDVHTKFMTDRTKVVVATNAFGMGVDKPDVRFVIHYNMPGTVEAYYQEAGRAGRDGLPAECILLFAPDDQGLQEWFIKSDTPTFQELNQVYQLLAGAASDGEVYFNLRELAALTRLHAVKLRVSLSELELAGAIIHMGDERGHGHWKVLSPDEGALEKRAKAIEQRANIRLGLLDKMLDYAYLTSCRRKFLLDYFGDTAPPKSPRCCDNHSTESIEDLPKAVTPQEWVPLIVLETVRSMKGRPVGRTRLAQVLSGSRAKGMKKYGYDRHKFYGKLHMLSQAQVTSLIDGLITGRYLRLTGGDLPVLSLTPRGQQALEVRAALPIRVSGLENPDDALKRDQADRQHAHSERSATVRQTLSLFKEGLSPGQIAARRGLAKSTIYTHLARLIGAGKVQLHEVVPPEVEAQVAEALTKVESTHALSPLKAILPNEITYGQIRCVIAAYLEAPDSEEGTTAEEVTTANGDTSLPEPVLNSEKIEPAPNNQQTPSPESSAAPDAIVLEAVAQLGGTLGRTGLAKFLTGSQASWLDKFVNHDCFGQLGHLSQRAVIDIIDALISDGRLETTDGYRPKVKLTEEARQHLRPIQQDPAAESGPVSSGPSKRSPAAPAVSEPKTEPNPVLLEKLRRWRAELARTERIPLFFVFSNKILDTIATRCPTDLKALGQISGIGPVKLEQYGQTVLDLVAETLAQTESGGKDSHHQVKETPGHEIEPTSPASSAPLETEESQSEGITKQPVDKAILRVVSDLEGLITTAGLVELLTAAPGEVVPFSDHELCGLFHEQVTMDGILDEVEKLLQSGRLSAGPQRRLTIPE